jgi:hypothetical protein
VAPYYGQGAGPSVLGGADRGQWYGGPILGAVDGPAGHGVVSRVLRHPPSVHLTRRMSHECINRG